jgi:hypothetical protein
MATDAEDHRLADDVPVADAVEQLQPAILDAEEVGLDPKHVEDRLQADADTFDVIDQAIAVPLPDDQREVDFD